MKPQNQFLTEYIKEKYGINPEHPWADTPEYATFKSKETGKWFALLMNVKYRTLGLKRDGSTWIVNVKADPELIGFISGTEGILPAYHMNKIHWITILLDGSLGWEQIKPHIDASFELVSDSKTKKIYEAVKKIPRGKVATYAQIAAMAGNEKMCRAVGNALHKNPDPEGIPCYRVVNSQGKLSGSFAFGGADEQARLLMADGVEVINNKVDLEKYQMTPD